MIVIDDYYNFQSSNLGSTTPHPTSVMGEDTHIRVCPGVQWECAAFQLSEKEDRSCCDCLFQSNKHDKHDKHDIMMHIGVTYRDMSTLGLLLKYILSMFFQDESVSK